MIVKGAVVNTSIVLARAECIVKNDDINLLV